MKKTIKILTAAILAVSFGSLVHAQSATISANATVVSEIAVARVADLNFGTLVTGQIKTIFYDGSVFVSTGSALGSANRGEFTVAAAAGSDVRLSFNLPTNLAGPGASTLPIDFAWEDVSPFGSVTSNNVLVVGQEGDQTQIFNPPLGPISVYDSSFPTFEAIAGTNSVRVFIGAQVDATGVSAGSYTGTITLSATYN
nr:hypothetical protein [Cytophagales bacterium]